MHFCLQMFHMKYLVIFGLLTLCILGNFSCFLLSADFFFKINFFQANFRNTITVSNCLDPDQARHFVRLDLGGNCLQKLSADDTRG